MWLKCISLLGMVLLIALAWAMSSHRRLFPWRTVLWGIGLQFGLALFILKTPWGEGIFRLAGRAINKLTQCADEGSIFVFGPLAKPEVLQTSFGPQNAFVFGISITGTIIIVSALSSLLYHWGVLQRVVHAMAWVMQKAMRTSGSETLASAANIFMGQTEAPLVIKPYVARMTRSELLCLMVGGMATIAGGVAAAYVQMASRAGHADFAGHLLTASVLSAPAALMIAKIMLPETERSETAHTAPATVERTTVNAVDALCRGASDGLFLSLNVMGMVMAFIAVVALVNFLLAWPQHAMGVGAPVTLQNVLGWINAPFAWLMGVPTADCLMIGQILGERIVINEFIGYLTLTNPSTHVDPRSFTIATYALCGFANFGSIAIQIGGIGALAPERRSDLAQLGFRAMLGGLMASYLTATIAGILIP
jgi:CNT family concentrative nucleoside transporter